MPSGEIDLGSLVKIVVFAESIGENDIAHKTLDAVVLMVQLLFKVVLKRASLRCKKLFFRI